VWISGKPAEKIQVSLKSGKKKRRNLQKNLRKFMTMSLSMRMRNVSGNVGESKHKFYLY